MTLCLIFCSSCCKEELTISSEQVQIADPEYSVSDPLHFDSAEALASSVWEYKGDIAVKSSSSPFISFAETIMREPGYEDRPNAILSERFGSVLNSEGEVEFANYLLKVTDVGILYAPTDMADAVRELSKDNDLLSLCGNPVNCYDINSEKKFYTIDGHDGVVLFDTFHFLASEEDCAEKEIMTKSISNNLVNYTLSGPLATFTTPAAGDQKVLFSDPKYCNDTKAFQQDYGVTSDGGLKTKTMKKNNLGIWSKFSNPIEGGITLFSVFEYGTYDDIYINTPDINKVKYGGTAKYVYTISARGTSASSHVPANIYGLVSEGNSLAQSLGLSIQIDGIRFVLNDTNAVTVFLNETKSGTLEKIDYNWPVPIEGRTNCTQSYLGNTDVPNYASYYVVGFLAYGQSTMNYETRGSAIGYNYWAN